MSLSRFFRSIGPQKMTSVFLVVNSFVWLSYLSAVLNKVIQINNFYSNMAATILWSLNSLGAALSVLLGAFLSSKIRKRVPFILLWILLGVLASSSLALVNVYTLSGSVAISLIFSMSMGIGLPTCMAYFAENTSLENRGRTAGISWFFTMGLGVLMVGLVSEDMTINSFVLTFWRALCFIPFFIINVCKCEKQIEKQETPSFLSVIKERTFIYYVAAWAALMLINHLFISMGIEVYGKLFYDLVFIENFLVGVFSIIGGFLCDMAGRKYISITGFVLLGIGYAIVGTFPHNTFCWHIYAVIDGVAWGMLCVVFMFTVWGDISANKPSEKYYSLASLPYILSNFLRFSIGPMIVSTLSAYAIFSFAAFFLFLAVIPLMFAPETLPERVLRERELRSYIERAKRVREKFTKG